MDEFTIGNRVRVIGRNERFKESLDGTEGTVIKPKDQFGRYGVMLPNRRKPSWFHPQFLESATQNGGNDASR